MKSAIYESKGRAREFSEYALNHYTGCSFGCRYCMAPLVTHKDRAAFHASPRPRLDEYAIRRSATDMQAAGVRGPVLLCFVTDPYQPLDAKTQLTRQAIIALHQHGLGVTILTKAGELARRDFDLLLPGIDTFATTLTCIGDLQKHWEPGAAPAADRIANLRAAYMRGLKTWVSCEPVVDPEETLMLVSMVRGWAGHFKFGPMNYHEHGKTINWEAFARELIRMQPSVGRPFYLKADLAKYIDVEGGLWLGMPRRSGI